MKQSQRFSKVTACVAALVGACFAISTHAAEGSAVVRSITGSAQYDGGGVWLPLKTGQTLNQGATVRTANDSKVDLFLDENGPMVRLMENTTVGLDKLTFEDTGVDVVVETQLDLKSGRIIGIVRKLAATSKYEIKTASGVAGVRGTEYDCLATTETRVPSGSMVVVLVKPDGTVVTQVVNSGEKFVPSSGTVEPIPADELAQIVAELNLMRGEPVIGYRITDPIKVFVSPTAGVDGSGNGSSIRIP